MQFKPNGRLADLHMHSTASDGGYSPEDLMKKCVQAGLEIVSLTDHDTTMGVKSAKEVAEANGMQFITGIELSTRFKNTHVDILGYGIEPSNSILQDTISFHQHMRVKRMEKMIEKCHELGLQIDFQEVKVLAKGDTLSRPHIAQALVNRGYVSNVKEAFDLYFKEGQPCYVEKEKEMTPQEAIQLIHQAGGIAIVAHPILYTLDDDIYQWLLEEDLDGVEVYHRDHDVEAVERFLTIAKKAERERGRQVYLTGGSDFHHESFGRTGESIGTTTLPFEHAEKLLHAVNKI
ncbi:putative metal-dependent phosphoesterase TrpH [Evansella vedderi]|uniref:Metal-dependent phosphoesterase TrpH n=1 Tax=Evansella vedderi TaxID=38282 RepID=A0ABU0A3G4_9BACI|nr:PHP domain-containing protein [Evansella vedderi]MDQ0257547.1 putative metal-dependent phosphoesterase TrpH [Evansella vedderi]